MSVQAEREKYEQVWTHDQYRDFSPGLEAVDRLNLIKLLRDGGVKSVLDAGCGTGKLMRRLLTDCGDEFAVHGFDIAANCLDPWFDDRDDALLTIGCLWDPDDFATPYDAILCTDVLEHIPTEHIPAVLANFHRCARRFCYCAIALFPDRFGEELVGRPLHLTVEEPDWWLARAREAGFPQIHHLIEDHARTGQPLWLHLFMLQTPTQA